MKQKLGVVATVAALIALPFTAAAQSITAAEAAPFLGAWVLMLDTPQGSMPMNVAVKNTEGKIGLGRDGLGHDAHSGDHGRHEIRRRPALQ